jgi:hypothetical protein
VDGGRAGVVDGGLWMGGVGVVVAVGRG